ncbi:hypothetical protein BR93DRAFT_283914 [Coniochaeta sp. PMI_546]|nr:hypothetical protein BR93DRAFT_283914 [Coniochaeta sp. PMI_546]
MAWAGGRESGWLGSGMKRQCRSLTLVSEPKTLNRVPNAKLSMRFHALFVKRVNYTCIYIGRPISSWVSGFWLSSFHKYTVIAGGARSEIRGKCVAGQTPPRVLPSSCIYVYFNTAFLSALRRPNAPQMADHQWNLDSANVAEARPALSPSPHSARQPLVLVTSASFTLCSCPTYLQTRRHSIAAFCSNHTVSSFQINDLIVGFRSTHVYIGRPQLSCIAARRAVIGAQALCMLT